MSWFFIAIGAYLIFSIVFLIDKYVLSSIALSPKIYAFYLGVLSMVVFVAAPFVDFSVPQFQQLVVSILAGASFVYAIFWFFEGLRLFEPSRIIPATGGFVPIFVFLFALLLFPEDAMLSARHLVSLFLLIAGSVLISLEKGKDVTIHSLRIAVTSAFFLAISFVAIKYVYLTESFWTGYIWMKLGGFFVAILFLLFAKEVKEELFGKTNEASFVPFWRKPKVVGIVLANQVLGASANVLQSFAIFLAPLAMVAVVNALQGVQYVFLLFLTTLLSWFFPKIVKERITRGIILQKVTAILLIVTGLFIIAFL